MLVLFDQGTPLPLRRFLSDHTVATAYQKGWSTLRNGHLLAAAEADGFEVFVTTDQNIQYQQNLSSLRLSVVVLSTTKWPKIMLATDLIVTAVAEAKFGEVTFVQVP